MFKLVCPKCGMHNKINSIHFAIPWLGISLLVGVLIPFAIRVIFHRFAWPLCVAGGIGILAFVVVFAIEMGQDFGKVPYYEKYLRETIPYDPEKQYAVIRSSICTGEKVAGFKNKADGHFTEVMLLKTGEDEKKFREIYHLDSIKTEY